MLKSNAENHEKPHILKFATISFSTSIQSPNFDKINSDTFLKSIDVFQKCFLWVPMFPTKETYTYFNIYLYLYKYLLLF
jgi:hypothetical protein